MKRYAAKKVQITEARKNLSKLLTQVEQEKIAVRIHRRGRAVAVLVPYDEYKKERDADMARMSEILRKGFHLGTEPFNREELYDRS